MKKKTASILAAGITLLVTFAPAAQANTWEVRPGGKLDPFEPIPCICLPSPDLS